MKKELKNYIAKKIFSIAYSLMPESDIKLALGVWYVQIYGGKK